MELRVQPLPGEIGFEVTGLALGEEIPTKVARQVRETWLDAGVVLFREMGESPEALLNVSRCLGVLDPHPIELFRLPEYPELILLSNENGLTGPVYEYDGVPTYGRIPWHTDLAFTTQPNAGAVFRMVKKSEDGGQTGWIDTAKAWEALDPGMRRRIEGLDACYAFASDLDSMRFERPNGQRLTEASNEIPAYPPVSRPLVWNHPETDRPILNVGPLNIRSIVGMPREEGDALIQELIEHTLQPRFQYIHDWAEDDIIAWDNFRMMHMAFGHPVNQVRTAHRSTIRGGIEVGHVIEEELPGESHEHI